MDREMDRDDALALVREHIANENLVNHCIATEAIMDALARRLVLEDRVDEEVVHAILAHAGKVGLESDMDVALYAADPTTGFIVAAALVRPDKSLGSVKLKSLKKRWKEKAFARGASREQMAECARLGLERDEFLQLSLEAMQARSDELGL
jgi:predicted hydrolase (HD superfamily)